MLEVFNDRLDQDAVARTARPGRPDSFDVLAAVRQQIALHLLVAESTLDNFRAAWL
jgi:hypothetical protein